MAWRSSRVTTVKAAASVLIQASTESSLLAISEGRVIKVRVRGVDRGLLEAGGGIVSYVLNAVLYVVGEGATCLSSHSESLTTPEGKKHYFAVMIELDTPQKAAQLGGDTASRTQLEHILHPGHPHPYPAFVQIKLERPSGATLDYIERVPFPREMTAAFKSAGLLLWRPASHAGDGIDLLLGTQRRCGEGDAPVLTFTFGRRDAKDVDGAATACREFDEETASMCGQSSEWATRLAERLRSPLAHARRFGDSATKAGAGSVLLVPSSDGVGPAALSSTPVAFWHAKGSGLLFIVRADEALLLPAGTSSSLDDVPSVHSTCLEKLRTVRGEKEWLGDVMLALHWVPLARLSANDHRLPALRSKVVEHMFDDFSGSVLEAYLRTL